VGNKWWAGDTKHDAIPIDAKESPGSMNQECRVQERAVQQSVFLLNVEPAAFDRDAAQRFCARHGAGTPFGRQDGIPTKDADLDRIVGDPQQQVGEELARGLIVRIEVERDPDDVLLEA
jgi:hypothetical protein